MKAFVLCVTSFALPWLIAPAAAQQAPSPAPVRPVSEQLYGQTIVDPYRYMEDLKNREVQGLMKAEATYTRAMLEALPEKAKLAAETVAAIKNAPPRFRQFERRGARVFYLKRVPGEPAFKLYVRTMGKDNERLVCDPAGFWYGGRSAHGATEL